MIGIISDIHGNLEALDAAFAAGVQIGVDSWVCLGDVVGYGANPNECIERVRALCDPVLLGNHDEAAAFDTDLSWFNEWAAAAAVWTRSELTPEHRAFLTERPHRHETDVATYVHASPVKPEAWHYIVSERDARANAGGFTTPFCFVGHSHQPGMYRVGDDKTLVNVGSVGQPRDGDPRSCFVVLDDAGDTASVRFVRVRYEIEAAQRKILAAGLPAMLAERLAVGR